jgi:hypothetical protein
MTGRRHSVRLEHGVGAPFAEPFGNDDLVACLDGQAAVQRIVIWAAVRIQVVPDDRRAFLGREDFVDGKKLCPPRPSSPLEIDHERPRALALVAGVGCVFICHVPSSCFLLIPDSRGGSH